MEYQIQIVVFGLTIQIQIIKYRIVNQILKKMYLIPIYLNYTRHFVLKIYKTIHLGILTDYWNTRILFGVPKNPNTEYEYYYSDRLL